MKNSDFRKWIIVLCLTIFGLIASLSYIYIEYQDGIVQLYTGQFSEISPPKVGANTTSTDGIQNLLKVKHIIRFATNISTEENITVGTLKYMELINTQRKKILIEQCQKLFHSKPKKETITRVHKAFVLEKFRLIVDAIPKTGRTTWELALWNNSLPVGSKLWKDPAVVGTTWRGDVLAKQNILELKRYNRQRRSQLTSFYKIITVRHPYSRLESVYLNKLYANNTYYRKHWGIKILTMFRKRTNENKELYKTGAGVTFEEFIKFVIRTPRYDPHFVPFVSSSMPCQVDFDYIAKTETINSDLPYIINTRLAGRGQHIHRNNGTTHSKKQHQRGVILELFSKLPNVTHYLTQLNKHYGLDMAIFGYDYEIINKTTVVAVCKTYTQDGICV